MHFIPVDNAPSTEDVGLVQGDDQIRFSSSLGIGWLKLVDGGIIAGAEGGARIVLNPRKRKFRRASTIQVVDRLVTRPLRLRKGDVVQAELDDWKGAWIFAPDANLSVLGQKTAGLRGWMVAAFALLVGVQLVANVADPLVKIGEESSMGAITAVVSRNASKLYPVTVEPFAHTYSPYLQALTKANREGVDLHGFTAEWIKQHGGAGKPLDAKDVRDAR